MSSKKSSLGGSPSDSSPKKLLGKEKPSLSPEENDSLFLKECESVYLTVMHSISEDITTKEELKLLLQHGQRNPSNSTVAKYWDDETDSYTFDQFCSIMKQESKAPKSDLLRAFKKIDANGDGFITHEELLKVLTKLGERMTKAEVSLMLEDSDFNGDGKLDYDEFCNMMEATCKECAKLHSAKKSPPVKDERAKSPEKKASVNPSDVRSSNKNNSKDGQHTDKLRNSSPVNAQRKGLKSVHEISDDDGDDGNEDGDAPEEDRPFVLSKLSQEPVDLPKWKYLSMKGCFYSEDAKIESHHYFLKVMQPSSVWISIKASAPKYGKYKEDLLDLDMTVFVVESQSGRVVAVSNSVIDKKFCLQADLDIGMYHLFTFSSGCKLGTEDSTSGRLGLVKGTGDEMRLTKVCQDALMEIFYRCDLDGNGFLSRDEFNWFQLRTSGQPVEDDAWDVVKENFAVTPQDELTPEGFVKLNLMEAQDPEGGQDELWVTLGSMGYSSKLQLVKSCPFVVEVFTKRGKLTLSLDTISDGGKTFHTAVCDVIRLAGQAKQFKNKRDLLLYTAELQGRTSVAIENKSHSAVSVRVNCSGSENLQSHQRNLDFTIDVEAKAFQIIHHLVPVDLSRRSRLVVQEGIVK